MKLDEKIMKEEAIFFLDLDETLITSQNLITEKQATGILRSLYQNGRFELTDSLVENKELIRSMKDCINGEISEEGFVKVLKKYGFIDASSFFKTGVYRTFNPKLAVMNDKMKLFDDSIRFLDYFQKNCKMIMSNSSQEATEAKLEALGLNNFNLILAQTRENAKPQTFMGDLGIKYLEEHNFNLSEQNIYVIGDQDVDVYFGQNLQAKYPQLNIKTTLIKKKYLVINLNQILMLKI